MSLIACGSIHEGHEWFSDDSRGRQEIFFFFMYLAALLSEWRRQDSDQVLLHEIIFFLQCIQAEAVRASAKITSIRNKLPTAACWSRKKKGGNCEANLVYVKSDFSTTDTTEKSFTVFFAR